MALDDRTAQAHLTPEARRALLRAFADRMLIKVTEMDDPEDMPGVERCVRVAAVIERIYSRCDRAESHAPDPRKLEAERAGHESEAIKARVALASTLQWGEQRRQGLGHWWDSAQSMTQEASKTSQTPIPAPMPVTISASQPAAPQTQSAPLAPQAPQVSYTDYTDGILKARADLGLPADPDRDISAAPCVEPTPRPPPPT